MVRAGAQLTGGAEGPGRLLTRRGRLNRQQKVLLAPRFEEVPIAESYRELNDPTSDAAEARSKRQVQTATYFASAGRDTFFNCDEEPRFINHSMHSEHTISK
jgi:hypothetical protein